MAENHVLEIRHLSKSFGKHVVLRDIDFTVDTGDVTCIIGASGSGKSGRSRKLHAIRCIRSEMSGRKKERWKKL